MSKVKFCRGGGITRELAHNFGVLHNAVSLAVFNKDGDLLIQWRDKNKTKNPNVWDISCSGHVRQGEKPIKAILREANEEIGLDLKEEDLTYLCSYRQFHQVNKNFIDNEYFNIYYTTIDVGIRNLKIQKYELNTIKWATYQEIKEMVYDGYKNLSFKQTMWNEVLKLMTNMKKSKKTKKAS